MSSTEIKGLVLAGGFSRRMGCDKALLDYHGMPQARWTAQLLTSVCEEVYYSCRADQDLGPGPNLSSCRIHDSKEGQGPIEGLLSAHEKFPQAALMVVACDLPKLTENTLQHLVEKRDSSRLVTAYRSFHDGLPEPLCAIYEPSAFQLLKESFASGLRCPRKILINADEQVLLLDLKENLALDNANTPDEADAFRTKPEER